MSLFSKNKNFLGIDIGSTSIKAVELTKSKSRARLLTYGFADKVTNLLQDNSPKAQIKIANLLEQIVKQSKITCRKAVTALPNFYVFSSVITVPITSKKSLQDTVKWEAKKIVPMNLEDVILDWKVLNEEDLKVIKKEKNSKKEIKHDDEKAHNIEILLTAAPRNLVQKYLNIFRLAKINLSSLETESFALSRSLLSENDEAVIILDIGSIASDIMIIEDNIPVISRSIDVGGKTITQAIERHLNIDFKRAEQFKRDIGILNQSNKNISQIIEMAFNSVVNEINYTVDLYKNRNKKINRVVLSGGTAYLAGLSEYLTKTLQIETHVGNPWHKITYSEELQPLIEEIGPRFAVAIGLALRDFE